MKIKSLLKVVKDSTVCIVNSHGSTIEEVYIPPMGYCNDSLHEDDTIKSVKSSQYDDTLYVEI